MDEFKYSYYSSPLGEIEIKYNSENIFSFHFTNENFEKKDSVFTTTLINETFNQLNKYFDGSLKQFNLPIKIKGTPFQQKVWAKLLNIGYGKTISYLQLAKLLGDAKCIRAAASANGKNPFGIIIPCHRVIGSNGSLTGYAGGIKRKQWLLEHESKIIGSHYRLF